MSYHHLRGITAEITDLLVTLCRCYRDQITRLGSRVTFITVSRRSPLFTAALGGMVGTLLLVTGCTSGTTLGSSGTVGLTRPTPGGLTDTTPATPTSVTPVTPDGLVTGSGVSDTTITLGLLADHTTDRGFSTGVALWQRNVNTTGGICGRTIVIAMNRGGESLAAGYTRVAGSALGLITMPTHSDSATLSAMSSADQIPTLTLAGSSAKLTKTGPVVIGATEDIKVINAFAYLRSLGKLPAGSVIGVLTDTSPDAVNALAGARWWAARNGVLINSKMVEGAAAPSAWGAVSTVLVIADPAAVRATLAATASSVQIITNLDGYDPATMSAPAGRLLVTLAAPAYGSDNPGAAAVAKAFFTSGRTDPGPELISGYGVGAAWGRLLGQACTDRALTHAGVTAAMTTVGPASVDSLFGPSDPGLVAGSALPATRVSSLALADSKAPAGLQPLIWLQTAPGITDYVPPKL